MCIFLKKLDSNLNNKLKKLKDFLIRNINSIIYLIILTAIVSLISYYRVLVQMDMGPVSDSFDFLSNALVFAGQGTGYSDLLRPPLFSFIIALVFKMGYIYSSTIFVLDAGLYVFGIIGMYLLLKTKFNDLESFLGALLYATFPVVLKILGFGFSDLVSVSFTIWAIYFMVLAVKMNSKYFYLSFPFAMLAFLSRYNSGLLIFPIFLYLLINKDKINFKDIIIGIIASILIIIPVFIFFYEKFGNMLYPFIDFGSSSTGVSSSIMHIAYNPNVFYFIQRFPEFVGIQGFIILLILILGILVLMFLRFISYFRFKNNLFDKLSLNNRKTKIKLAIIVFLVIIFLGSFGKTLYIVNELLFFAIIYIFYDLIKNLNIKDIDLHLMFLMWFMAFFIFHSIFVIKNNRYFVVMAPPVAYFMIFGLTEISNRIKLKIRNIHVTFPILAIILTSVILLSTATTLPLILEMNNDLKIQNNEIQLASQWLVNYDPNYKNENIYSDLWPNFSWYLKTNVKMVPIFEAYQILPDGTRYYYVSQADNNAFNNYLVNNNADYFFCDILGLNLTSYKPIKEFGNVILYKKIT